MKTIKIMKRLMGCAAAILALTACSESEDLLAAYHSDSKAVHITAQVGKASADGFTRSNPLGEGEAQKTFNKNDEISVKADGQEAVTYKYDGKEWLPLGGKFLKWESDKMNFTAFYPATFNGTITQPMEYESEADLAAADFMSFSGPQENKNNNKLTLTMKRQMARVVVEIAGFNDQYTTNATVNSLSICGVKAYKQEKEGKSYFYALIDPKYTSSTAPFLSLEVKDGESTKTETLTTTPTFVAGKSYTYQLKVGKNKISVSGITVADWTPGKITDNGKAEEIIPYVTFTANGEQKFKMTTPDNNLIDGLEYSVNGGDWKAVVADTEVPFGGDKGDLRLRGTKAGGTSDGEYKHSTIKFTVPTVKVACTGDIRTLLNWKYYYNVDTQNAKFCYLFEKCSVLTSAPELPATTLAEGCYTGMFSNCTNLTSAPELPATTLAENCYTGMFYNCTKLPTVTMLALSDQITKYDYCCTMWLDGAGTEASSRTLKVKDEAAYNALATGYYLPDNWKKGDTGATVLNKDNGKIE